MSRKQKHAEHVNHERWLVSWADFMTLLFALFTALYAISTVDQKKASSMAESARAAFSVDVVKAPSRAADKSGKGNSGPKHIADAQKSEPDAIEDKSEQVVNPRDEVDPLSKARAALQAALPKLKMHANIELKNTKTSIVITLKDKAFFRQGSAKLLPGVLPVLNKVAEILLKSDLAIRVEGHTDDQPSTSKVYTSNWELSAARAVSVVRYFAEEYSYPPQDLGVAGYASGRPVASNSTEEGRQANRRVDIILLAKAKAVPTNSSSKTSPKLPARDGPLPPGHEGPAAPAQEGPMPPAGNSSALPAHPGAAMPAHSGRETSAPRHDQDGDEAPAHATPAARGHADEAAPSPTAAKSPSK